MNNILKLTNKNITVATPLILYSMFSTIYMFMSLNGKIIQLLFAILLLLLMTAAFIAGWGNMIKTVVETENSETQQETLFKDFVSGVGEYILPILGAILIIVLSGSVITLLAFIAGNHFIGDPNISTEALSEAMKTTSALKSFVTSLSPIQLEKLQAWNLLLLSTMTATNFVIILYFPAIFLKNKNPFLALFISLKDLFSKKFFKTLGIYFLIFVINLIISILSNLTNGNFVFHFLLTLINFYFITAASIGVFYYYNEHFIKSLIGKNVDIEI